MEATGAKTSEEIFRKGANRYDSSYYNLRFSLSADSTLLISSNPSFPLAIVQLPLVGVNVNVLSSSSSPSFPVWLDELVIFIDMASRVAEGALSNGPKSTSTPSALWKSPKSPKLSNEESSISSEKDDERMALSDVVDAAAASEKGPYFVHELKSIGVCKGK
jgi:hypothetical protein